MYVPSQWRRGTNQPGFGLLRATDRQDPTQLCLLARISPSQPADFVWHRVIHVRAENLSKEVSCDVIFFSRAGVCCSALLHHVSTCAVVVRGLATEEMMRWRWARIPNCCHKSAETRTLPDRPPDLRCHVQKDPTGKKGGLVRVPKTYEKFENNILFGKKKKKRRPT